MTPTKVTTPPSSPKPKDQDERNRQGRFLPKEGKGVKLLTLVKKATEQKSDASHVPDRRERFKALRRSLQGANSSSLKNINRSTSQFKSFRRGSMDWHNILRPFVSNLAYRCVVKRRSDTQVSFKAWSGHAAILFVDISGYSKVTSAIAHKGAHALSSVVNSYLERILTIVANHAGDVVSFAGDAIFICWEGKQAELKYNVMRAAQCAIALQEKAGHHQVEGTPHAFRIHTGLSCGLLDTEIFQSPHHLNMQKLYLAVGGDPVIEIDKLVNLSKAGETCISSSAAFFLEPHAKTLPTSESHAVLLAGMELDEYLEQELECHTERLVKQREMERVAAIEEDFIHPSILQLLLHSGNEPTQIAQMRNLCVFFIGMTSQGSSVNWLMEVQGFLDARRCPIVQIIDDDKGVHVIAALNLYESVPDAATIALDTCRDLVRQKVGCCIGLAMGSTFCGVTGSSSIACRWDITGPPPVRAARLMQYANSEGLTVAIDKSIYENTPSSSRMSLYKQDLRIKGTPEPIPVYTLSHNTVFVASMIMENLALAPVHKDAVSETCKYVSGPNNRGALVLTGPPLSGKKAVLQRAAGLSRVIPVLHTCDVGAGHLQLAQTMVTWYSNSNNDGIREKALNVQQHLTSNRWSRAHDTCVELINRVVNAGYKSWIIVERCQFLDDFSMSLVRECIAPSARGRQKFNQSCSGFEWEEGGAVRGKLFFLFTHAPFYNLKTAEDFVEDVKRTRDFDMPIIRIGKVSIQDLYHALSYCYDVDATDEWLRMYGEQSGHSVGYFFQRIQALRVMSSKLMSEGKRGVSAINRRLQLFIPPCRSVDHLRFNVMQVNPDAGMRFSQCYDDLPPRHQLILKIICAASGNGDSFPMPLSVVKQVMKDSFAEGFPDWRFAVMIDELKDVFLIHVDNQAASVSLPCPAISDVVVDVCTPLQLRFIREALLLRLEPLLNSHFHIPLICAILHEYLGECEKSKALWADGYNMMLNHHADNEEELVHQKKIIKGLLEVNGEDPNEVLGPEFVLEEEDFNELDISSFTLKNYTSPIAFGPMGHTLNVITRNVYREIRKFHGCPASETYKRIQDTRSAFNRYRSELRSVEDFLSKEGFGVEESTLEKEMEIMESLVKEGDSEDEVCMKADTIFDELIPNHWCPRMERLYKLAASLHENNCAPRLFETTTLAVRLAWEAMCHGQNREDAAQRALVILAAMNWMPDMLPEELPLFHYQTIARVRTCVLRRLTDAELAIFKHQHSADDLDAFLICNALLDH